MALDFVATVYSGDNATGLSRMLGGGRSHRSDGDDGSELMNTGFWHAVQSVRLSTSADTDANLLLIANDDYSGQFVQLTLSKGSGVGFWDTWGNVGSLYAVATNRRNEKEIRQSVRQQLGAQWIAFLDAKLANTPGSREGDPLITWQAFPHDQYLDQSLVYLVVRQALNISIDWWPDYAAAVTYHLLPYVDGAGHVRVWGARWGMWVEGGLKNGKIADALRPAVISGLGELEGQVNSRLALLDLLGSVKEVYILPGNQVNVPGNGVISGDTNDDATIVVVR